MSVWLTIKGSRKAAARAAARRHLSVKSCNTFKSGKHDNTSCEVDCSKLRRVMDWYGEKPGLAKKGRGFPPGTLTFFNHNCKR